MSDSVNRRKSASIVNPERSGSAGALDTIDGKVTANEEKSGQIEGQFEDQFEDEINAEEVQTNKVLKKKNNQLIKEEKKRKQLRRVVERESKRIIQLIVPISLCMLIVVLSINFFPAFSYGVEEYASQIIGGIYEKKDSSAVSKFGSAIMVAAILLVLMVVMTFCMAFIIIYEFDRCIKIFFIFSFVMYFAFFGSIYLCIAFNEYNIAIDWLTVIFIVWNYTGVGLVIFFIAGPKLLKQTYLILLSSNMALILILVIPNWTAWLLLVLMAVWDCYAVLHETGPLNRIFSSVQDNKRLPPIIYSTAVWLQTSNTKGSVTEESDEDNSNIDIGLGDFIFYSLLVGKSFVSGDFLIAIICYISILVGLAITLYILLLKNIPLPALPISIAFGVIANFLSTYTVIPFNDVLMDRLIFI